MKSRLHVLKKSHCWRNVSEWNWFTTKTVLLLQRWQCLIILDFFSRSCQCFSIRFFVSYFNGKRICFSMCPNSFIYDSESLIYIHVMVCFWPFSHNCRFLLLIICTSWPTIFTIKWPDFLKVLVMQRAISSTCHIWVQWLMSMPRHFYHQNKLQTFFYA